MDKFSTTGIKLCRHWVLFLSQQSHLLCPLLMSSKLVKMGIKAFPEIIFVIEVLDLITFVIFTIEYFTRLICSPGKWKFFIKPMNLVDFIAILPFFISMILEELSDYQIIGKAGKIIGLMKVMRTFRFYILFRHFAGLQSLLYTLYRW